MVDLSAADKDALGRMPADWFSAWNLSHMVRRPFWRCDRLVQLGALESRVSGSHPTLVREYRKTPSGVLASDGKGPIRKDADAPVAAREMVGLTSSELLNCKKESLYNGALMEVRFSESIQRAFAAKNGATLGEQ